MKIAVFHNYLDNIGGAEIVALTMARELFADIYTTNIDKEKIEKMGFADVLPRIFSIGKIPKNAPFRQQLALWKFRKLNLKGKYDFFIIAGDWAMSGAVKNKPNLWYVHSPLNELWAFKNYIKQNVLSWWKRPVFEAWVSLNRLLTKKYARKIDAWVCNSQNTQNRVKQFYGKTAGIIYPPVYMEKYKYENNKNYWLSVNRLSKAKRIGMQINAFSRMPGENLVVVGSYEKGSRQFEKEKKDLFSRLPKNVEIISWADSISLAKLYAECKGFITTSRDEDFGMAVVEAMAAGKPVIAPNEGGYKESILNGQTGILINNMDEEKLVEAVKILNSKINKNSEQIKKACQEQAKNFGTQIFIGKIRKLIS